jgi:hypothetical protein
LAGGKREKIFLGGNITDIIDKRISARGIWAFLSRFCRASIALVFPGLGEPGGT